MYFLDRVRIAKEKYSNNELFQIVHDAYVLAFKKYDKDRKPQNYNHLRRVERDLVKIIDNLDAHHHEEEADRASSLPDPLENYHQVYKYLVELGYQCSTHLPARAVRQNKLSPRKGGGFSKAAVRRFAATHKLRRPVVEDSPADDRPAIPVEFEHDGSPAAEKIVQQARLARIQADKMELALQRDRGNLVPAADQAITLASFAAVVEHEIKAQMRSKASKLLAVVHGDSARKPTFVREMTDLVDAALRHAAEIEEYRVQFESLGQEEA